MLPMFAEMDQHIIDANKVECKLKNDGKDVNVTLKEFKNRYSTRECSIQPLTPMGTDVKVKVGSRTSIYCAPRILTDTLVWEDRERRRKIASQVSSF
jgi:hypothetical protein